jgi:hypothetical protein
MSEEQQHPELNDDLIDALCEILAERFAKGDEFLDSTIDHFNAANRYIYSELEKLRAEIAALKGQRHE